MHTAVKRGVRMLSLARTDKYCTVSGGPAVVYPSLGVCAFYPLLYGLSRPSRHHVALLQNAIPHLFHTASRLLRRAAASKFLLGYVSRASLLDRLVRCRRE